MTKNIAFNSLFYFIKTIKYTLI